jgi:hypothetical protein
VLKNQDRSFEASWKSATIEHFGVKVGKYLHVLHRGFASHLAWVQLDMGHCGPLDKVGSLYIHIHHIQGSDNMLSSTYHTLSATMVSRRPSSLTDGLSLWHDFGNNYMSFWAPISSTVQPIIPRRTGKLNESIKSSRI